MGVHCRINMFPWTKVAEEVVPDPYIVSTWYDLLGDFSPREHVNPAVDYRLIGMGEGVCETWHCIFCGNANQDMREVVAHIETEHSPDSPARCVKCSMVFKDIYMLDDHYGSAHPLLCPTCPTMWDNNIELMEHMESRK